MTTSELADKIINNPSGYPQESVEVAKGYKELESRVKELEDAITMASQLFLASAGPFDKGSMLLLEVIQK